MTTQTWKNFTNSDEVTHLNGDVSIGLARKTRHFRLSYPAKIAGCVWLRTCSAWIFDSMQTVALAASISGFHAAGGV